MQLTDELCNRTARGYGINLTVNYSKFPVVTTKSPVDTFKIHSIRFNWPLYDNLNLWRSLVFYETICRRFRRVSSPLITLQCLQSCSKVLVENPAVYSNRVRCLSSYRRITSLCHRLIGTMEQGDSPLRGWGKWYTLIDCTIPGSAKFDLGPKPHPRQCPTTLSHGASTRRGRLIGGWKCSFSA